PNHAGGCRAAVFAPDGQTLATGDCGGAVHLWTPEGKQVGHFKVHRGVIQSLKFLPDGRLLPSAGLDSPGWASESAAGKARRRLGDDSVKVVRLGPPADGRRVRVACGDGGVRLCDVMTGQVLSQSAGHTGAVHDVVFAPDGSHALSVGSDKTMRL